MYTWIKNYSCTLTQKQLLQRCYTQQHTLTEFDSSWNYIEVVLWNKVNCISDRQGNNYLLFIAAAFHCISLQFSFHNLIMNILSLARRKSRLQLVIKINLSNCNRDRNTAVLPEQSPFLHWLHNFWNPNYIGKILSISASQSFYCAGLKANRGIKLFWRP